MLAPLFPLLALRRSATSSTGAGQPTQIRDHSLRR